MDQDPPIVSSRNRPSRLVPCELQRDVPTAPTLRHQHHHLRQQHVCLTAPYRPPVTPARSAWTLFPNHIEPHAGTPSAENASLPGSAVQRTNPAQWTGNHWHGMMWSTSGSRRTPAEYVWRSWVILAGPLVAIASVVAACGRCSTARGHNDVLWIGRRWLGVNCSRSVFQQERRPRREQCRMVGQALRESKSESTKM